MRELIKGYYCSNCNQGIEFKNEVLEHTLKVYGIKGTLNQSIQCRGCNNQFPLYQGMIESLVTTTSWPDFICDVRYFGQEEITLGNEYTITLPSKILIYKIFLTNNDGLASIAPFYYDNFETDSFKIVSSQIEQEVPQPHDKEIGQNHKVSWLVYGKSGDKYSETWIQLLAQIKEQIRHGQYNIAALTSEMMFESFLDKTLNALLVNQGISDESAYIILESINSIYNKAHGLLESLNGKGLKDEKPINKEWIKLMELRNKIAHGEDAEIDVDKAKWALRTALNAVFFVYNSCNLFS
ncbi:MAG: hypothetical protein ACYCYO_00270 [Bacilli bacterium]